MCEFYDLEDDPELVDLHPGFLSSGDDEDGNKLETVNRHFKQWYMMKMNMVCNGIR
jgi:hypothetical protein